MYTSTESYMHGYDSVLLITSQNAVKVPGQQPVDQGIQEEEDHGIVRWRHVKLVRDKDEMRRCLLGSC